MNLEVEIRKPEKKDNDHYRHKSGESIELS